VDIFLIFFQIFIIQGEESVEEKQCKDIGISEITRKCFIDLEAFDWKRRHHHFQQGSK